MLEVVPFDAERDFNPAFGLWQTVFARTWPLDPSTFRKIILDNLDWPAGSKQGLVALEAGVLVGLAFFQYNLEKASGNLSLVLVAPAFHKQGVGMALHNSALGELQRRGIKKVQLGGGFWHGLPDDLNKVAPFFEKLGWEFTETSYDLTQDMRSFNRADEFINPVLAEGISFRLAEPADAEAIVAFQKAEFPNWLDSYENVLKFGDFNDLLLVCRADGSFAGMVILYTPRSNPQRLDVHWQGLLGENAGALGCVGIAHSVHNRGTGSAMMAWGMRELEARGVGLCHIIWTFRVTFYERLGFKLWKSYRMSWRNLE